jgi:hypothetical protein
LSWLDEAGLSAEGASDDDASVVVSEVASDGDASGDGVGWIVDVGGHGGRSFAVAGYPASGGGEVAECFVGSEGVVGVSPAGAVVGEVLEGVTPGVEVEEFALDGGVQPFDLSLGLGVVGSSVERVDVETDEGGVEGAETDGSSAEGVVAEDGVGESDVAEEVPEDGPE